MESIAMTDFVRCMPMEHNACCGAEKHWVVVFGLIIDCFVQVQE